MPVGQACSDNGTQVWVGPPDGGAVTRSYAGTYSATPPADEIACLYLYETGVYTLLDQSAPYDVGPAPQDPGTVPVSLPDPCGSDPGLDSALGPELPAADEIDLETAVLHELGRSVTLPAGREAHCPSSRYGAAQLPLRVPQTAATRR